MIVRRIEDLLALNVRAAAHTLQGFRDWVRSDDFPEQGSISLIAGEILIDMSPEKIKTHNLPKKVITRVIDALVTEQDLGVVFTDRAWVTNDDAGLSTEPDALFATWETLNSGRLHIVTKEEDEREEEDGDGIELTGSPDWALEVISRNSRRKDAHLLPIAYSQAGVKEYWLVDALADEISFTLFVRESAGFVAAAGQDGWLCSPLFGREFRLERDRIGGWRYTLSVR